MNTSRGEIALQRRDAHLLDKDADVLQRLGRGLDGRRHLGIDWPKAGSDHPAHPELAVGLAADTRIELDGARGERVLAVRPDQLRESERDIANRAGHRPDMPEAARRARPDAGHGHAAMRRLHGGDAGLRGRATHRDGEIGAETDRRHSRRDGRRFTAARTARSAGHIPRVVRSTGEQVITLDPVGEFGKVGLRQ